MPITTLLMPTIMHIITQRVHNMMPMSTPILLLITLIRLRIIMRIIMLTRMHIILPIVPIIMPIFFKIFFFIQTLSRFQTLGFWVRWCPGCCRVLGARFYCNAFLLACVWSCWCCGWCAVLCSMCLLCLVFGACKAVLPMLYARLRTE